MALQPAPAEGYGSNPGGAAPLHQESWLPDGYWLDGAAGAWAPVNQPRALQSERYPLRTEDPALAAPPSWPSDHPSYRSGRFADKTGHRDLQSSYPYYGRVGAPGGIAAPVSGSGFRPIDPAPLYGQPVVDPFSEFSFGPYAAERPDRAAYSFRPELKPRQPERVGPVWYRERASGKRYLFRPVSQEELVSRPSDHSFNSPRYAQPESADPRYMARDGLVPVQGGFYGQPGGAHSSVDGWGDAYGGPVYGFE